MAVDLDGTDGHIPTGLNKFIINNTDLTVGCWFITSEDARNQAILNWEDDDGSTTTNFLIDLRSTNSGEVRCFVRDDDADYVLVESGTSQANGVPHAALFTWDVSTKTAELFVDGISEGTNTNTDVDAVISNSDAELVIGRRPNRTTTGVDAQFFDGIITEVFVSYTKYTATQIANFSNSRII